MTTYPMRTRVRKRYPFVQIQTDLFAWAESHASIDLPTSRAAQVIARRFALSPSIARLVAEQAGFRMEANHG